MIVVAATDPNVLTALIGAPAAMITAIGTVWAINRVRGRNGSGPPSDNAITELRHSLRDLKTEMRDEVNALRSDMNARFDLLVKLINDGRPRSR